MIGQELGIQLTKALEHTHTHTYVTRKEIGKKKKTTLKSLTEDSAIHNAHSKNKFCFSRNSLADSLQFS